VVLERACDQFKIWTKLVGELLNVVSPDIRPAAPVWSQWSECGNYNASTRLECSRQQGGVGVSLR
jgi:hypothetical protein